MKHFSLLLALAAAGSVNAAVVFDGIYGSHMVLPQGRQVPVTGTTDTPSKPIEITFGSAKVKARIEGKTWKAVLPPLPVSTEGKALSAEQGDSKTTFEDVLVGEVWLASGQSNMLFRLNQASGGAEAIAQSANPLLRIYHAEPQVPTSSPAYGEKEKKLLQEGNMFAGSWAVSGPASTPRMSAVGYYFGQKLQKELGMPVGVIHTSLGGSEMMAWLPASMLKKKEYKSCATSRWLESPYMSAWVRGRARQNIGSDLSAPHPYKPSYLFETGIAPWTGFPISGVIWYQGESDAEIASMPQNKKLLTDLIASWREAFRAPELPFAMVQLPRIRDKSPLRAYWPEFRQVQSEVAREMPGVYNVVTIDLGSTNSNVHPPRKVEVGERLANTVAACVYGKKVPYSGPVPVKAQVRGSSVVLGLKYAQGLATADGAAPTGFEVAGRDGRFVPAEARIEGSSLVVHAREVAKPAMVRYGWFTYMEPNLVNSARLPAAPFSIELKK